MSLVAGARALFWGSSPGFYLDRWARGVPAAASHAELAFFGRFSDYLYHSTRSATTVGNVPFYKFESLRRDIFLLY